MDFADRSQLLRIVALWRAHLALRGPDGIVKEATRLLYAPEAQDAQRSIERRRAITLATLGLLREARIQTDAEKYW